MKKVVSRTEERVGSEEVADVDPLVSLVNDRAVTTPSSAFDSIVVGELIGIADQGRVPLIVYPGQRGSAAIPARSVVDLHGAHVGKSVVLVFEAADPGRPIILGVVRSPEGWPLDRTPEQVEIDTDGERLTVTAKEELVLQCGEASITLTKAGKVPICGNYVSSRSSGVNTIKGGSVHIN